MAPPARPNRARPRPSGVLITLVVTALAVSPLACVQTADRTPPRQDGAGAVADALLSLGRGDGIELVDLTHPLGPDSLYWPTGGPFEFTRSAWGRTDAGYWYAAAEFRSPEHLGTHLDAPIHFAERGWTNAEIPVDRLFGEACLVDIADRAGTDADATLQPDDLTKFEAEHGAIPPRAIVLVRTGWSARWPDWTSYYGTATPEDVATLRFPGVSEAAATELAKRGVAGVGIDTASIDPGRSVRFEAHQVLAAANIFNLENLTGLDRLPARGFVLVALPMKIAGGTGGPTRVVALVPELP